jgi:hypothetical protein
VKRMVTAASGLLRAAAAAAAAVHCRSQMSLCWLASGSTTLNRDTSKLGAGCKCSEMCVVGGGRVYCGGMQSH